MKYPDGQAIRLGDKVRLGTDVEGVVVASIDTGEFGQEHPEAQWGYLKKGVMIEFKGTLWPHSLSGHTGLRSQIASPRTGKQLRPVRLTFCQTRRSRRRLVSRPCPARSMSHPIEAWTLVFGG